MGYQIHYAEASVIKIPVAEQLVSKRSGSGRWIIICIIVLSLVFAGKFGYLDFLIPGDKDVTRQAFSTMVEDVKEGGSVRSAVTAFCQEILDNAELDN